MASLTNKHSALRQSFPDAPCASGRILLFNDPRMLQTPQLLREITNEVRQDAQVLTQELLTTKSQAIAAPLIGIPKQILAFLHNGNAIILLNPIIVQVSDFTLILREKCACCPQLSWARWRPNSIQIQFTTLTGETQTLSAIGPSAQLLAHHIEHLKGVMPFSQMTAYEHKLASLSQSGQPIPKIMAELYQSLEEMRAQPGTIVAIQGNDDSGFKAVWRDERTLDLIEMVKGQERTCASLDARQPLELVSEVDSHLFSFLANLSTQSKMLLAGTDDFLLHLRIAHLFPEAHIVISEERSNRLAFAKQIFGEIQKEFVTLSHPLTETLEQAKNSRFGAILMNRHSQHIEGVNANSFEALVRMASKGLTSTGVLLLKYSSASRDVESHKSTLLKVFPDVYILEAQDGIVLIGARSKLDLSSWEGAAYRLLSQAWSNLPFSPKLCRIGVVKSAL